jgi:hypothetical protein
VEIDNALTFAASALPLRDSSPLGSGAPLFKPYLDFIAVRIAHKGIGKSGGEFPA